MFKKSFKTYFWTKLRAKFKHNPPRAACQWWKKASEDWLYTTQHKAWQHTKSLFSAATQSKETFSAITTVGRHLQHKWDRLLWNFSFQTSILYIRVQTYSLWVLWCFTLELTSNDTISSKYSHKQQDQIDEVLHLCSSTLTHKIPTIQFFHLKDTVTWGQTTMNVNSSNVLDYFKVLDLKCDTSTWIALLITCIQFVPSCHNWIYN